MKRICPNKRCQKPHIIKKGSFFRKEDSRKVQRFRCKNCGTQFSAATLKFEYRQQKRRVNFQVAKLLCAGVSQREAARILCISRGTVARRLLYWGKRARKNQLKLLKNLRSQVEHFQMDDLVTKENSKLKPLTVTIGVDANSRLILGAKVSQIPSFGHLAKISRRKYGKRNCFHQKGIERLLQEVHQTVSPFAVIRSDDHQKYPRALKTYLPGRSHFIHKSIRACVAGQGELKKCRFDPLFAVNHTCAMLRAKVGRLIRKTWNTTKNQWRLQDHLDLYVWYFNDRILKELAFRPSG